MRMRFNTAEKALIASGAPVEVRTGRYWHPAIVTNPAIERPFGTIESVKCEVTSGKYKGQTWHASPTALRAATPTTTPEA